MGIFLWRCFSFFFLVHKGGAYDHVSKQMCTRGTYTSRGTDKSGTWLDAVGLLNQPGDPDTYTRTHQTHGQMRGVVHGTGDLCCVLIVKRMQISLIGRGGYARFELFCIGSVEALSRRRY